MKFKVSNGPFVKSSNSTSKMMTRLLIALIPIICLSILKNTIIVYFYTDATLLESLHPIFMIIVSIITSYVSELLYFKFILKYKIADCIHELNKSFSIIPGVLLSLVLPVSTPLWVIVFGAFFANIFGKMIYGGFGQNIFNPALIGYLFISASYSSLIGTHLNLYELDTLAGATPLTNLASLNYVGSYDEIVSGYGSLLNFFVGSIPGSLGEVSKMLIIFAFVYLTITKTIKYLIPIFYVGTVFVITYVVSLFTDMGIWYPIFHILSGGLLFGAVFMATDPVTSPITKFGQIFHGICLGILTVSLRFFTSYPEGVMTSILFMNMFVPLCDKIGLSVKNNLKKVWIYILVIVIFISMTSYFIINKISYKEENKMPVNILETKKEGDKTIYNVSSKGWGLIKATVTVENGEIISIDITDKSGETQWSELEKNDYVNKAIEYQDNIDSLDAVSGSTFSSDGIKNIIKKILESELNNEK